MYDDERYTDELRRSQSLEVKRELDKHVRGDEIPSLALMFGLSQSVGKLVAKTPEQIAKIRQSKKYIDATPEQRKLLLAPKRVGGGSTENQLVRRLFSNAQGSQNRLLLPVSVIGESRLALGDLGDPFLYSRVVLAQCVTGGMLYDTDARGQLKTEEYQFGLLSGAVSAAEGYDSDIASGNTSGVKEIGITGVYLDWTLYIKRYLES